MLPLRRLFVAVFLAFSATAPSAHEFWIDAKRYQIDKGETIDAALRVGERFEGTEMPFLPGSFRRFEIALDDRLSAVERRMGDRPALSQAAKGEGLAVVIHVTSDSTLVWRDFARFEAFVTHKGALWSLDEHAARGLPKDEFAEGYSRHAKALVAVGTGAGADRAFGLETELVALANPYTDDLSDGLPVALFYRNAPRPDAQIEIFDRALDGRVTVSTARTDSEGRVIIPVQAGHVYMLDSVVLRQPEGPLAERPEIVWESLWANLTFGVPG